jgi:AmpD protein
MNQISNASKTTGGSKIVDGTMNTAQQITSPNYNQRPSRLDVSLLVIHNISLPPGEYGTGEVENFFCNRLDGNKHPYFADICSVEVSAHLFISRLGEVTQFVNFENRAWHAGLSVFDGSENCNDFSIGIELEGTDEQAYTQAQYLSLVECTLAIQAQYPAITTERITGHSDISPGRKTDPGQAFDWDKFKLLLTEYNSLVKDKEHSK